MKRRVFSIMLSIVLVICTVPSAAFGANVEDYPVLGSNFNTDSVRNDPPYQNSITVENEAIIRSISTYHWNDGNGKTPGAITVYEDGSVMGTWNATGRSGSGVENIFWDIFPDIKFSPGHEYSFSTSSDETWSWNEGTGGAGMVELRGGAAGSDTQTQKPADTDSGRTTVSGYTCADWAASEISKAAEKGLIPESLSGGDLTEDISRQDFASVSLKTYEKMSGVAVSSANSPFSDTNNEDISKAYSVGIVNGTSADEFSPIERLTREQASTMLTRAYKKIVIPGWSLENDSSYSLDYTRPSPFEDQNLISPYAQDSVSFMSAKGIVKGVGENTFAPLEPVTRQEALIIAMRMTEKLDTTPQSSTPGSASEGPAQGTLSNGECSVTFKTTQNGDAVLVQDGSGYDLLLTDKPAGTVQVNFPAAAPAEGTEGVVYLGVPCLDENGNQDFEKFPLDSTYSDGKVTAEADLSQYANAVEEAAYSADTTTATGRKDYSAEFAKKQADAVKSGVNVGYAVYFFYETEYLIQSDAGHFKIYIPMSTYNKGPDAVAGKINKEDAKRIVEDMESILSTYKGTYNIKRTNWPMKVIFGTGNDGEFGSGRMKLNWTKLSNGYGRDMDSSMPLYETMAHELFHFVQREYTPVALSQSWFDEASAGYYGIKMGEARSGNLENAIRKENYSADAEAQYQGITPMDVATLGWFDFLHAGYGRASFIDYLMRYHGSDFLKRYYDEGVTLAGMQTEYRLEKLTGKTLGELAEDFYCKLVLEKDAVFSVLSRPSDIFERNFSYAGNRGEASLDHVRTTWELTGENESTVISVPRYGAYFTALDMKKLSPNAKSFTLTVPTADCAARLIGIKNNTDEQYSVQKVYEPSNGKFADMPVDGTMYLLMMINTNGGWGWTVSETLNITYEKFSTAGPYPSNINEIPQEFRGKLTCWDRSAGGSLNAAKDVTVRVSEEGGFLTVLIEGYNDFFAATGSRFFDGSGYAELTNSDGGNTYVQMQGGTYVDRTTGPKPTDEELENYMSPFGIYIEGESTTNGMRIVFFDRNGRMNVFEGTGENNNSFYYDPEIILK